MNTPEPIAIIGSGCKFPNHVATPSQLWKALSEPQDLLGPIPGDRFSAKGFYHESADHHGHTNVAQAYYLAECRRFDAQFFGIHPAEAKVMDPQMRLLLETVYEALESAGQTIDGLKGSDTAVYTGVMTHDYEHSMGRDQDSIGTYHVTGTARALLSNRISYFFDWRGPSVTLDTACSSSLFAVHYAMQQLRSGASRVAVATGANLLLDPMGFISESKLKMLSPNSRSRMWDADADGYARGEGIAAVVLKTLSAAQADGDDIECLIRGTAVNQDGKTRGITVPSAEAQASLIRDCYRHAGLDISKTADRPQYFEAHGTGTPAGDPVEAEAIHMAFGDRHDKVSPRAHRGDDATTDPLYVGSAKTVMGHTEGTAGIAGLLKASLAIQARKIPPNLLFERLNPRIQPFYHTVCVPTSLMPWPSVLQGHPRRASVNSFGFGGANAHAIIESYSPRQEEQLLVGQEPVFLPFIFSAASKRSLINYLASFVEYLGHDGASVCMQDLAHTLQVRRTRLPSVAVFTAATPQQLAAAIESTVASAKRDGEEDVVFQPQLVSHGPKPRVLAVFTGQGAQWALMGTDLVSRSPSASQILARMESRLALLPLQDRPTWSLTEELHKDVSSSNVGAAAISQPLCTAVQVILAHLLRASGVELSCAVGHSSGEIAAAYAAGLISAEDAVCIAYYRGLYAHLAQGTEGQPGAMMAVETSPDDALDILQEPEFRGRACIAAINASSSVTISGDADVIDELAVVFKDEGKFARRLKVDKAYHSHHMRPCSAKYLSSLERLNVQVAGASTSRCPWFSTVHELSTDQMTDSLKGPYWDDNMQNPVLFQQAIERACGAGSPFSLVVEIGPHPALKRPVLQTTGPVPYTGLLRRGVRDIESIAQGFGYMAAHLPKHSVNYPAFQRFVYGTSGAKLVKELPPYSWDHDSEFWHESRYTRAVLKRPHAVHELLGHLSPNSTERNMQWRNVLRPQEVAWLKHHQLQGQIVFPASGYVVAALEASLAVLGGSCASCIEISEVEISRPLVFDSAESSAETVLTLSDIQRRDAVDIAAKFTFSASTWAGRERDDALDVHASGRICLTLGDFSSVSLPAKTPRSSDLIAVNEHDFYSSLNRLSYQYADSFYSLSGLNRKLGRATGTISDVQGSPLLVHPAVLDGAFQSVILSAAAPDDGKLWSMHVPVRVGRIRVNPGLCAAEMCKGRRLPFDAFGPEEAASISGDVDVFPAESDHAMLQVEGLEFLPLSRATARDDRPIFSSMIWGPACPDAARCAPDSLETRRQYDLAHLLDRVACFYLRNLDRVVPSDHPSRRDGPYKSLFKFAAHTLARATSQQGGFWKPEWDDDTTETISEVCQPYASTVDVRMLCRLGQKLPDIVTGRAAAIELAVEDGLLAEYYDGALGQREYATCLARIVKQITFRFPHPRCLEIGAGTGATSRAVLRDAGHAIASYTFTDVSSGFFEAMQAELESESGQGVNRMLFKTLDIGKDVCAQGFEKHSYDLIIASMVLHVTPALGDALSNIRSLIRPGGYVLVIEPQPLERAPAHLGTLFGAFPGWWQGSDEGRDLSPAVSLAQWDGLLRKAGFSGIDTSTPDPDPLIQPLTLFVSQALDEKIEFLREPLSRPAQPFGTDVIISELVVLGGSIPETSVLATQLRDLLRQHCRVFKTARTLMDLGSMDISASTTVLSLTELDGPVFLDLTEPSWSALKSVLQGAGQILWVTRGRFTGNVFVNMTAGLLRSAMSELPGLKMQFLDFESRGSMDCDTIGTALLQFVATISMKGSHSDAYSHVTMERELVMGMDGRVAVPRWMAEDQMNDRYNSRRRSIFSKSSPHEGKLHIETADGVCFVWQELSAMAKLKKTETKGQVVTHSTPSPATIAGCCRLFLALGKHSVSGAQFLSLSTTNSSAMSSNTLVTFPVDVPSGFEARFLQLVRLLSLCRDMFRGLDRGDGVLIHEPSHDLMAVMRHAARARGISIIFTTAATPTSCQDHLQDCVEVHPNAPERTLQNLELESIAVFADFADTIFAERIRSRLTNSCRFETNQTLFGQCARAPSSACLDRVRCCLEDMATEAERHLEAFAGLKPHLVGLDDVSRVDSPPSPQSVVEWTAADELRIRIQPVDVQPMFQSTKTYWLAGLTSSLGLSLCKWMVRRGARHVVMSSRQPAVSVAWLDEMASLGAVIKVYACNVTKKDDVVRLHRKICDTLPPLAGVVQGAMVLIDAHLSDMSLETLLQNTRPKVEGSIHLNELFLQDVLDFFVFLSSASVATGTPGQSAYVAANMFMVGLAEKRRRLGLAASVINMGPVAGVGFLAHQQRDWSASAVLAGLPGSTGPIEITSGVRYMGPDEASPPVWKPNPMMGHFHLRSKDSVHQSGGTKPKPRLRTQLVDARHLDEVGRAIREAFVDKIGTWFQLDASKMDRTSLDATHLDAIGIDSLIAINISFWLMENLGFNLPVLKILSGMSVGQIVAAAIDGVSVELIPNVKPGVKMASADQDVKDSGTVSVPDGSGSCPPRTRLGSCTSDREAQLSKVSADAMHAAQTPHAESREPDAPNSRNLSSVQSMFWVNSTLFASQTSQNFAGLARILGPIDVNQLQRAVFALGQRHESLRTRFFSQDGNMMQSVMGKSALRLEVWDVADDREAAAEMQKIEKHNFAMEKGETLRLVLLSISPSRHFLVFAAPHVAMDGFSAQVILQELLPRDSEKLDETRQPPMQYGEYLENQQHDLAAGKFTNALRFWKAQYSPQLPSPLPILRVSRASTRASLAAFSEDKVQVTIHANTTSRVGVICREHKITPFHFYLACYRVLLARNADAQDVVIGVEDAGRRDGRASGAIGVFLNVLPLRFRTELSAPFTDVVQETRTMMHAALENAGLPFPVLLSELDPPRSTTCTPIIQTSVNYGSRRRLTDTRGGCKFEFETLKVSTTGYDLHLDIVDDPDGSCLVTLIYRSDLYRHSEASMLITAYEKLVDAFSTKPNATLAEPRLFAPHDVQTALAHGLGPISHSKWPETVVHRIQDVTRTHPNSIAIRNTPGHHITYLGLSESSESIAMALRRAGASNGSKIAVLQEPTPAWVASILAIMRTGAVYLPLDLSLPWPRLATIARNCQPEVVLVDETTVELVHELGLPDVPMIDVNVPLADLGVTTHTHPIEATSNAPAIVFHTSGSSGVPKGVVLTHEALRNHMELTEDIFSVGSEVVLQQSACSFDLSCAQVLTALCFGGSIFILPRHLRGDPSTIVDLMVNEGITYTFATPSEYSSWLGHGKLDSLRDASWRRALCVGEPFPEHLLRQFRQVSKADLLLFNCYGPTETTIVASAIELQYQQQDHPGFSDGISSGFALPNHALYILDDRLDPVAPGVQGEIYIGGAAVSPGYLQDSPLTAKSFVENPFAPSEFSAKGWTTMHRSGDVGRWNEDGSILVEGRLSGDTRIKLRGFRVDLRDVENNLLTAAGGLLSQAAVSVRRSSPESPDFLVAHVVFDSAKSGRGRQEELDFLRSLPNLLPLPEYMCPAVVVDVEQLPRTSSSKVDRRTLSALPLPDIAIYAEDVQAELTPTETQLRDMWRENIPQQVTALHNNITPSTDYFHVGGTSLLLPHLQAQILAKFGVTPPIMQLLQFSTLGRMARLLGNRPLTSEEATVIDWEAETAPSLAMLESLAEPRTSMTRGLEGPRVVVLTGCTGYLGRAILDALIADDAVEMVHCVGVRGAHARHDMTGLPKTRLHDGNLELPLLGLTARDAGDIFGQATRIIHNGAEVSHVRSYSSLRLANVQSTKELVELSLAHRIPMHYVSSTQVGIYYAAGTGQHVFPEVSVATFPPPTEASFDGYPASKWASESFLERLLPVSLGAGGSDWPIFIHRPSTILRPPSKPGQDLLANLRRLSAQMRSVPRANILHGHVDRVELSHVVSGVVGALHEAPTPGVHHRHYFGPHAIALDDPKTLLLSSERDGLGPLEELDALEWVARAREEGLDLSPWLEEWMKRVLRQGEQVFPKVIQ